mmetsp:Transcript_31337/g.38823  ORF Transcript_31337/g.38823 Transcript_31337/m.38823 type:complete len:224 (-) Transcript_31337:94-765(-)
MPDDFLSGKLARIVPAKSDVAFFVVSGEGQREDALGQRALSVGQINEKIRSVVTNDIWGEAEQAIADERLQALTLTIDADDAHICGARRLAEVSLASASCAETDSFANLVTFEPTRAILDLNAVLCNHFVGARLGGVVALNATAAKALLGGDPEPVGARVEQDVQGLAWCAYVEVHEDLHAVVASHGAPGLLQLIRARRSRKRHRLGTFWLLEKRVVLFIKVA